MEETVLPLYKTRSALGELFSEDSSSLTLIERVDVEVELYKGLPPISHHHITGSSAMEKRATLCSSLLHP
jgi:hypothetical protein